jgi:hypothetical protein
MLIYEKVKETTAHLPSDRPIKNRHLEVSCNNVAPELSEHFEFRHFRPHYLDVDTIFGD